MSNTREDIQNRLNAVRATIYTAQQEEAGLINLLNGYDVGAEQTVILIQAEAERQRAINEAVSQPTETIQGATTAAENKKKDQPVEVSKAK